MYFHKKGGNLVEVLNLPVIRVGFPRGWSRFASATAKVRGFPPHRDRAVLLPILVFVVDVLHLDAVHRLPKSPERKL